MNTTSRMTRIARCLRLCGAACLSPIMGALGVIPSLPAWIWLLPLATLPALYVVLRVPPSSVDESISARVRA